MWQRSVTTGMIQQNKNILGKHWIPYSNKRHKIHIVQGLHIILKQQQSSRANNYLTALKQSTAHSTRLWCTKIHSIKVDITGSVTLSYILESMRHLSYLQSWPKYSPTLLIHTLISKRKVFKAPRNPPRAALCAIFKEGGNMGIYIQVNMIIRMYMLHTHTNLKMNINRIK